MKIILVYSPDEARRNSYVVSRFENELGAVLVAPDYRGDADVVINRSNNYAIAKYYESKGVRVFNGAEFTRLANDKQLCYDFMQNNSEMLAKVIKMQQKAIIYGIFCLIL